MTCATTAATIKSLLKGWNERNDGANARNELRKMAGAAGLLLEDYIEMIFSGRAYVEQDFDAARFPLRALALECIKAGYLGADMRGDPEETEVRIRAMASGRIDEHDLNQGGVGFWKAVQSHFAWFQTRQDMKQNQGEKA
jgi:hypothetical protein